MHDLFLSFTITEKDSYFVQKGDYILNNLQAVECTIYATYANLPVTPHAACYAAVLWVLKVKLIKNEMHGFVRLQATGEMLSGLLVS